MSVEKVAILDAGAQYGKVIDRRVRELSVFSDILPINTPIEKLMKADYNTGIADDEKRLYGVQFHPEVDLSPCGLKILKNFLFGVCNLKGDFKINDRVETCTAKIREAVGKNKILILLSGGVDSTVCAALLSKTLDPSQIIAVHIDNGFLRKDESTKVIESLKSLGIKVHLISAGLRFLSGTTMVHVDVVTEALAPASISPTRTQIDSGVSTGTPEEASDPSTKECKSTLNSTTQSVPNTDSSGPKRQLHLSGVEVWSELQLDPSSLMLCQGTLRPDLIESASHLVSQRADTIKTHHNTTMLVQLLQKQGRVVEPLSDFHKDEVRQIGKQLGLPESIVNRHPFPGPGLAVRILCAAEPYIERDFSETTSLIKMIAGYHQMSQKPHALLNKINAAARPEEQQRLSKITANRSLAAYVLPIRTVGVQGDHRSYSYACALSSSAAPDWDALSFLANLIPRICHNINRVVYILGPQVLHPVNDVTVTYLREPVIDTLREVDDRVMSVLQNTGCMNKIDQMPIVLIPIHFDRDPSQVVSIPSILRSIVLRPVKSADFMTCVAAVPGVHIPEEVVYKMQKAAEEVPGISRVLYDLTSKPPATIEWE
ncbi:unnamed protein product [Heterobilharzia americana]|nr:unnamed protein product [Heterobilharzia americana]